MDETIPSVTENPFDQNQDLLAKWLRYLLYANGVMLAVSVLAAIPGVGSTVTGWINNILRICTLFFLFRLAPANPRYRKSVIFSAIGMTGLMLDTIAGLLTSICTLVGTYQEYHAHSELIQTKDTYLSDKWRSLFLWEIGVGLLVSPISVFGSMLAASTGYSTDTIVSVILVVVVIPTAIIKLLYLKYLKAMLDMLRK